MVKAEGTRRRWRASIASLLDKVHLLSPRYSEATDDADGPFTGHRYAMNNSVTTGNS
ncbi:hypothetical protein HMPREF9580_01324 [Cutibacterium acnes HL087PA2]|nr:hypothetical protein HMPREF9580_01324 [Cutibacterium acnes HL087PA2]